MELEIRTDNAAFDDGYKGMELGRILREIAKGIEHGQESGTARDINGNIVGKWEI